MDTGRLHLLQGQDGAGQFALKGPLVVDLLHKVAHAELGVVEQLESDRSVQRQLPTHEGHAGLVHRLLRHQERLGLSALTRDLIGCLSLSSSCPMAARRVPINSKIAHRRVLAVPTMPGP